MAETPEVFAYPAQVRVSGMDTAALITMMREQHALDPSVFDDHPPFFFNARISSNQLDTYFTRMDPATTLPNFAEDAAAGVSFQDSHKTFQLGFGRSLTGKFVGPQGDGIAKVTADFYTVPGLRLNDIDTDNLILGIRTGIVKDVSVGFYGGIFRCSICARDMLRDWNCWHIPGIVYQKRDPDSHDVISEEQATATVEDAHLAEVSAVFDGATPGAAILKAQSEATRGRITDTAARLLERRYRIRLPEPTRQASGADVPQETTMPPETTPAQETPAAVPAPTPAETPATTTPPAESTTPVETPAAEPENSAMLAAVETALDEAQAPAAAAPSDRIRLLGLTARSATDELTRVKQLNADLTKQLTAASQEIATLRLQADDGKRYRDDLITETLAEGVRAYGATFDQATYKALLEPAPLDTIKRMRDDWRTAAEKIFKPGRKINETPQSPQNGERPVPDAAYQD